MTGPPKIDDFDFPDADTVTENKKYLAAVKKTIMGLRNSVKIKGTLAADLMVLYGIVNNDVEAKAKFEHYAHPRHPDGSVTCKFKARNCCLLFDVVLLIGYYQEFTGPTPDSSDKIRLDVKLKFINSVMKDGLQAYGVKGSEREGYVLVRR